DNVYALAPSFIRAFTVAAALGLVFRIKTKMHQRIVTLAGFHDHIAALATIAAGWASARDELLPAEGEAAVTAVASLHTDCGLVDEHGKSAVSCQLSAVSSQPSAVSRQ